MKIQRSEGNPWTDDDVVQPPKSIPDQVYALLKKKILYSEIEAGARLMQEEVAAALKASRTPVREAFRLLEQDGLVERIPQGGVRVTRMDADLIQEICGIRGALEAYGIELACERITPEGVAELKRIRDQAVALLSSTGDRETQMRSFFDLNSLFHEAIYRASRSPYLVQIINNLRNVVLRMRAVGLRAEETWRQAWEEHSQLIECLERRDKAAAAELMRRHIITAAANVIAGLKAMGRDSPSSGGPQQGT